MQLPFEFEEICLTSTAQVSRAKVPGGWLVYVILNSPRGVSNFTSNFIEDAEHKWEAVFNDMRG